MGFFMVEVYLPEPLSDDFFSLIPKHRAVINDLIERGIVSSYTVDEGRKKVWILFTASNQAEVQAHLKKSPIYKFVDIEIFRLFIADGDIFRLHIVNMN